MREARGDDKTKSVAAGKHDSVAAGKAMLSDRDCVNGIEGACVFGVWAKENRSWCMYPHERYCCWIGVFGGAWAEARAENRSGMKREAALPFHERRGWYMTHETCGAAGRVGRTNEWLILLRAESCLRAYSIDRPSVDAFQVDGRDSTSAAVLDMAIHGWRVAAAPPAKATAAHVRMRERARDECSFLAYACYRLACM
jgi:hypothetical protein